MKSSNNYPLNGLVNVDEFVIESKAKDKQGRSTKTEKIKL